MGVCWTFGFSTSPFSGPREKDFAFHDAFVTVPSENFRMKPPSPM